MCSSNAETPICKNKEVAKQATPPAASNIGVGVLPFIGLQQSIIAAAVKGKLEDYVGENAQRPHHLAAY